MDTQTHLISPTRQMEPIAVENLLINFTESVTLGFGNFIL